ncbi:MAG: 50S ribosomal protein L22 [Candidatus Gygaella obscura]|nr:50S ribosomal protein L22 [Candidatus Gygaella obscura]
MIVKAKTKYLRISPKKARQLLVLIKGKNAFAAMSVLRNINKKACVLIKKVLNSAINNGKAKGFDIKQLYVSKCIANSGPSWKRFRAASFGRAVPILKRTTHLEIELDLLPQAMAKKTIEQKEKPKNKPAVKKIVKNKKATK